MVQGVNAYNNPYVLFNFNKADLKRVNSPARAATALLFGSSVSKAYAKSINYDRLNTTSSFYSEYRSSLNELSQAADQLDQKDSVIYEERTISSSSEGVTVSAEPGSPTGNHTLTVDQLATQQENVSRRLQPEDATSLDISRDSIDIAIGTDVRSIAIDRSANQSNGEVLAAIAEGINAEADFNVSANVVTNEDGSQSLAIQGTQTGAQAAFTVSGELADGLELNNPTQFARNARGSLDGVVYTSSSNTLRVLEAQVSIQLEAPQAEPVYIENKISGRGAISAFKQFVNSFNRAVAFLQQSGGGAQLVADQLTTTTERNIESLEPLGVTFSEGSIQVDEARFQAAFDENPDQAIESLTTFNGLTASVGRRTEQALRTPAAAVSPQENEPLPALKYNYQRNSNTVLLNQLTTQGSIIDVLL